MPPDDTTEVWMNAQQYAQLQLEKQAVSAAIETYEKAVAAADKRMI
jgi:plasmid maintenance system antidote protein VapI